jgi:hypothetical protein
MMPVQTQMQMRSFLKGKKKRQKGSCFEQSSRRPNVKKKMQMERMEGALDGALRLGVGYGTPGFRSDRPPLSGASISHAQYLIL